MIEDIKVLAVADPAKQVTSGVCVCGGGGGEWVIYTCVYFGVCDCVCGGGGGEWVIYTCVYFGVCDCVCVCVRSPW